MITIRCTYLFPLILLLIVGCGSSGDVYQDQHLTSEQINQIDTVFAPFDVEGPGVTVFIAKGNELLFCKGYGYAHIEESIAASCDTNYRIASVSKMFTAMAILNLVDRGQITLETKLIDIISEFPAYTADITIRHLITHQSGLASYSPIAMAADEGYQLTDQDVVNYLITLDDLDFPAGTNFEYSNSAYAVLAVVVERVSGQPFHVFMRDNIFNPSGMENSQLYVADPEKIKNRAYGYTIIEGGLIAASDQNSQSAIQGDGSIYTSARDFLGWHRALNTAELTSPSLQAASYQAQPGTNGRYGYGWYIPEDQDASWVEHGGLTTGFISYVIRIPDDEIMVGVFLNRGWSSFDPLAKKVDIRARALLSVATNGHVPMPALRDYQPD